MATYTELIKQAGIGNLGLRTFLTTGVNGWQNGVNAIEHGLERAGKWMGNAMEKNRVANGHMPKPTWDEQRKADEIYYNGSFKGHKIPTFYYGDRDSGGVLRTPNKWSRNSLKNWKKDVITEQARANARQKQWELQRQKASWQDAQTASPGFVRDMYLRNAKMLPPE